MDIEHNSREKFYRFPFGAVTCGGEVRLRLAVSGAGIPSAVRLVYMEDGKGEVRICRIFLMSVTTAYIR